MGGVLQNIYRMLQTCLAFRILLNIYVARLALFLYKLQYHVHNKSGVTATKSIFVKRNTTMSTWNPLVLWPLPLLLAVLFTFTEGGKLRVILRDTTTTR